MLPDGGRETLPKVCHTHPTMMKVDLLIIPYPKKIQKLYEARNTTIEVC